MSELHVLRFFHLVAAAVWVGGLLVLAPLIVTLNKHGVSREALQASARTFGRVTWAAMVLAIVTGLGQVWLLRLPLTMGVLNVKIGLVAATIAVALYHQFTARAASPLNRRITQSGILMLSLAIVAVAVAL
ncbi:MAG: hypothetical protein AAFQ65_04880 [Myxococcota bacterium]